MKIGTYEPSTNMACFTNNTGALQQREQTQMVVGGVVTSNVLSRGLLSVKIKQTKSRSDNKRNREKRDGGNDEDRSTRR